MFHFKAKNEELNEIAHPLSDLLDGDVDKASEEEDDDSRSSSPSTFSPVRQRLALAERFRKRSVDGQSDKTGLLRDLKGRIVKTVEDKISEYKQEKRSKIVPGSKHSEKELCDVNESISEKSLEQSLCFDDPEVDFKDESKTSRSPKDSYLSSFKEKVYNLSNLDDLKRKRLKIGPSAVQGLPTESETPPPEIETGLEADEKDAADINEFKDPVDESGGETEPKQELELETEKHLKPEIIVPALSFHPCPSPFTSTVNYLNSTLPRLSDISRIYYYLALTLTVILLLLPYFLSGFVLGLAVSVMILINYEPNRSKPVQHVDTQKLEPIFEHHEEIGHEDWFFELSGEYDTTKFKTSMLTPIHVQIKESVLTVLVPRKKFKLKRQQEHGEEIKVPNFIQRRTFNLKGAHISLLPKNLSGLRIWSRRYPIQILFPERQSSKEVKQTFSPPFSLGDFHESSREFGDYEIVHEEKYEEKSLVLFLRTDRAKDKWLRLLSAASRDDDDENLPLKDYTEYMQSLLSPQKHPDLTDLTTEPLQLLWFNTLMGRIMYDFLTKERWKLYVKTKLERKLAKIKFPQFMGDIRIADIDLGKNVPVVLSVGEPVVDRDTGLWIDLDIDYEGGFQMSIETKLNMLKIADKECEMSEMSRRPDSFSDSGTDDEEFCDLESDTQRIIEAVAEEQRTSKLSSVFDKITQSRYFQQASEHKYVRKALEGVSGLRLMLQVEVRSLKGKLVINIPPPPADRIWYGFRFPPDLSLKAVPKAGERTFTIGLVTDWIEKQLIKEFQNVFVLPNMDEQHVLLMDADDLYC